MAQFHFVEDYEKHIDHLVRAYPLDEAMSRAVGGDYERIGAIEADILRHYGMKDGDSLLDLGCGSGRLPWALSQALKVDYTGLDVIPALLDYAKNKAPSNYRFILNRSLKLPVEDQSFTFCSCFSVFTHLLHAETYLYLEEMFRVLEDGGKVVFSFLEFATPAHWTVFENTLNEHRRGEPGHLNQFMERSQIAKWAEMTGFRESSFLDGGDAPWPSGDPLGQSVAVLVK